MKNLSSTDQTPESTDLTEREAKKTAKKDWLKAFSYWEIWAGVGVNILILVACIRTWGWAIKSWPRWFGMELSESGEQLLLLLFALIGGLANSLVLLMARRRLSQKELKNPK